jgi:hypothetical protein
MEKKDYHESNRQLSLDFTRGLAVILMVFSHGIYFFNHAQNPFLDTIARTGNTFAFSTFLFVSAAAAYIAHTVNKKFNTNKRIIHRFFIILSGYLVIAISASLKESSNLFVTVAEILLIQRIPRFSEFLIPFAVFTLSFIPLGRFYRKIAPKPLILAGLSTIAFIAAVFLYQVTVPAFLTGLAAIIVGHENFRTFPLLWYLPIFLAGLGWGHLIQNHVADRIRIKSGFETAVICYLVTLITAILPGFNLLPYIAIGTRWPPSLGFLTIGLTFALSIELIYHLIKTSVLLRRFLVRIIAVGMDSYDIFIVHLLLLFCWEIFNFNISGAWAILLVSALLLAISVIISGLHVNFSYPKIHFHHTVTDRYRIKKRYLIILVFLIFAVTFQLNLVNPSQPTGNIMTKSELSINVAPTASGLKPEVTAKYPIEISSRTWHLLTPAQTTNYQATVRWRQNQVPAGTRKPEKLVITIPENNTRFDCRLTNDECQINISLKDWPAGIYTLIAADWNADNGQARTHRFRLTYPLYVAWTLDWEGWDVADATLVEIDQISRDYNLPVTHFFNPRLFIAEEISPERKQQIAQYLIGRISSSADEIGLHLHMQTDLVEAAGITAKLAPRWGLDTAQPGYDVPLTIYSAQDLTKIIQFSQSLFTKYGLPQATGFRAGGWYADEVTLKSLANAGFFYDASGREHLLWGGIKTSPWNLTADTQPYFPSAANQNETGDNNLPILEIPNTAGNTYEDQVETLIDKFEQVLPLVYSQPEVRVILSHPQWADTEFPKIQPVLEHINRYRHDRDLGPVVMVTTGKIQTLWNK